MTVGRVTSVEQDRAGVTLDGDHPQGVTSLTVAEAFDLEDEGGHLSLPSGEVVEYGPVDTEGVTVPLLEPLPEPVEDAELLEVFPPLVGTVAYVTVDDVDESDDSQAIPVSVPSGVAGWSSLAPGASLRFEVTRGGDLVATDVTAGSLEVAPDQVSSGTIRSEWRMSRDGAIVIGDDEVGSGELTHDGLRFSVPSPLGMYENVVMTTGETSFGVMGEDGTRLGGVDAEGNVSGPSGSFDELSVGGETLDEILWRLPRGLIARQFKSTAEQSIVTGVERAYMRVNATLYPGRQYRIRATMRARLAASGGALTLALRWSTDGEASLTSAQLPNTSSFSFPNASANHRIIGWAEGLLEVDVVTNARFLLTYRGDYGATPSASLSHLYIEDLGVSQPLTGGGSEGDPNDEDIPDVQQYTTTWQATASRMYDQTGAAIPDSDGRVNLWYWHADPIDFQQSAVLFAGGAVDSTDAGELSKNLPTALSGATITKVEVYLRNKVWHGVGIVALSALESASLPASKVIDATQGAVQTEGSGWWHNVPPSWFTNGTNRGVCLGDKDGTFLSSPLLSGSFHGPNDTDPPLLRITYTR